MMRPPKVFSFDGVVPVIDPSAFVHPSAVLIGDVVVGPRCYVGPLASLRGDFGRIILEAGSNLQDSCVMHSFPGEDSIIEIDGHVGHGAILHGCCVGRNALIGMNSVIMDKAEIGENAIVAACAFVNSGMKVPANSLVAGVPAKLVRELTEVEMAWKTHGTRTYQLLAERSRLSMHECEALSAVPADRKLVEWAGAFPLVSELKAAR
jgi:phenylacetic acid degradation protein